MTDQPQGPGWWQASDGNWYPPATAPLPEPPPSKPNPWQRFRGVPFWAQILTWVVLAFIILGVIGAAAGSGDKKKTVAAGSSSSSSSSSASTTTTTTKPTTTTTKPTTTTTTTVPTTTLPPQPVDVLDISGKNKTNSDNFTVKGRWTIHAEVSGGAGVLVSVRKASTDSQVDYFDYTPPGGDSAMRGDCTCYLQIEPFGSSYHIVVTDDVG
jgi:hypothetical protein